MAIKSAKEAQAKGLRYLETLSSSYDRIFADHDLLMSPVMPVLSIGVHDIKPQDTFNEITRRYLENRLGMTAPTNVVGIPAMSVPLNWGDPSGLPIGTMFQAKMGGDRLLYELAYELEEARPWKDRWAPYSIKYLPL